MGKGGLVGEVSIDFAVYAEANKTSTVSLPLKNSNSNAILHVSILNPTLYILSHIFIQF